MTENYPPHYPQFEPPQQLPYQQNPYQTEQQAERYPTEEFPPGQLPPNQAGPPNQEPPRPSGSGKLIATVAAVALAVGGVSGAVGGYLVAGGDSSTSTSVSSLNDTRPARQTGNAPEGTVESVAETVTPSVVQIQVSGRDGAGEGSGFVITDDGYILTNNHVVAGAADGGEIRVLFPDGKRVPAEVIGRAPSTDIAVIRAEGVSGLTPVELGRSDDLRVGQGVVAIGSPFELSSTVTSGIISALNRPVRAGGSQGDQTTVMDAVQTDAAINPGNSGGPLVDMTGRVIGINSAIYSPRTAGEVPGAGGAGNVGIGFAIPIDQARRIADEIMKTGKASQTYIGAKVTNAPDGGAQVVEIVRGSPAEKAGLKVGDVVVKLNDRVIADADELVAAIRTRAPGEDVTLKLSNDRSLQITLGEQPAGQN